MPDPLTDPEGEDGQTDRSEIAEAGAEDPEHHREQVRQLQIRQLREQVRAGTISSGILGARLVSQWCLAGLILAAGLAVVGLLKDSLRPRTIVVGEIQASPALKAGGFTPRTLAARLADQITELQSRTRTRGRKLPVTNGWPQPVRVEIPDTGVSIDQLQSSLRHLFIEDATLDGELLEDGRGLRLLTIRGTGVPAQTFSASATELDALMRRAAEHVMASLQPAEFAAYLIQSGHSAEAVRFSAAAFPRALPPDHPALLTQWGNALLNSGGSSDEAIALYERAIRADPSHWSARSNIVLALIARGEEQRAHGLGRQMRDLMAAHAAPGASTALGPWYQLTWNPSARLKAAQADANAFQGVGSVNQLRPPLLALLHIQLHDPVAARFQLRIAEASARSSPGDSTILARLHLVRGLLALEGNNPALAVRMLRRFADEYRRNGTVRAVMPTQICWLAHAERLAGALSEAERTLASAGRFVDCRRVRADLLAQRGPWPAAEQAYAAAVHLAPDLPAAYLSWALALQRRGRPVEAIERLEQAVERGPCWADPRKVWGDILVTQGRQQEGMRRYDEALALAPAWKELADARRRLGPPSRDRSLVHPCRTSGGGMRP